MNKVWACDRLRRYLVEVKRYEEYYSSSYTVNKGSFETAMALEPAAKAIMRRVHPDFKDYVLADWETTEAITWVVQTLALIEEAEEIEANLGPVGPRLSASELHPWVWEAARSLWETAHYREAVQAASTSVNAHLQAMTKRLDVSDYKLVTELFSDKDPELSKPRLRWPGEPTDESFKSMQAGLRSYGSGIFQCIRNRATHDLTELTEAEALERLAAMSLFCRWIVDDCRLDEAPAAP